MLTPPGAGAAATFYFDPGCPWTWATSRWLVAAAAERGFAIRWRTMSLALLNDGKPVPAFLDTPEFRARMDLGARALRVVQAGLARDDNEGAGRFYAEWGARFFEADGEPSAGLLQEAADAAGLGDLVAAADDGALDQPVADSLAEAERLAGPDVGSPVLHVGGSERGIFGPVVSPPPSGDDVGRLWDMVVALAGMTSFYELKRGRADPPEFRPA